MSADAEILALFRQWCTAWRASNRSGMTEEEISAAVDVANSIAERIYDAPVAGAAGLAVKAYMVGEGSIGHTLASRAQFDPCVLGGFADSSYAYRIVDDEREDVARLYLGAHALRGLLASAAQVLPELEPLVRPALASPLTLALDDADTDTVDSVRHSAPGRLQ